MTALDAKKFTMLEKVLIEEYVPYLPALLNQSKPEAAQQKNKTRAFSAFALGKICDIPAKDAAAAIVDDFDDYGVDAIYYHAASDTLYFLQAKLKASATFSQEEALAFCQGIRKLLKEDFTDFNANVQKRKAEIEGALANCARIQLVIAHTGTGISQHALKAFAELNGDDLDERLAASILDYDAARTDRDLIVSKAYPRIDTTLQVSKCQKVEEPRVTYFGLVSLTDMIDLHDKHGPALFERNIRTFLGHKTEVNASIQKTLRENPADFMFLNNGITALCQEIEPKGNAQAPAGGKRRLKIRGFSVINGAQTIASSARFHKDNPGHDLTASRVSITLIKADADGDFGKAVTRARNHQNPVHFANFAALDDEQERLRRELALLDIHYAYKAGSNDGSLDDNRIRIDEAAQALAMLQNDPRYVVWLKKEPAQLLDTTSQQYRSLFNPQLSGYQLANAVKLHRYVQARLIDEAKASKNHERLVYKHGNYALAWLLTKQVRQAINAAVLMDKNKIHAGLSASLDQLRQAFYDHVETKTGYPGLPGMHTKGPLAFFRNQSDVTPFLQDLLISVHGLAEDAGVKAKLHLYKAGQHYPEELFDYLISKAPQIGNLA